MGAIHYKFFYLTPIDHVPRISALSYGRNLYLDLVPLRPAQKSSLQFLCTQGIHSAQQRTSFISSIKLRTLWPHESYGRKVENILYLSFRFIQAVSCFNSINPGVLSKRFLRKGLKMMDDP